MVKVALLLPLTASGSTSAVAKALKQAAGFKAWRWVVERTQSWMHRFRRVVIRWDKKVRNSLGFLHLACAYITYRQSGNMLKKVVVKGGSADLQTSHRKPHVSRHLILDRLRTFVYAPGHGHSPAHD